MQIRVDDRRPFLLAFATLIGLAWLALWGWDRSPYARFLHHDAVPHAVAGDRALLFVFVAGWVLMTVAMMLPTSLPLIALFHAMTGRRPGGGWLLGAPPRRLPRRLDGVRRRRPPRRPVAA